ADAIRQRLTDAAARDARWRDGRVASLVYYASEDILEVAKAAYLQYFSENGLGLKAFPSLARFEREIVEMLSNLFHGLAAVGSVTSGGTESNLLAVKTARDQAAERKQVPGTPEIVMPVTAHASFDKAAHYFGLKAVRTHIGPDFRADVAGMRAAIGEKTVLLVASAPSYVHGVIDPVEEIGKLALEFDLPLHIDSCMGGFMLPFLEQAGYPLPPFDFRVAGVTSISADIHKYGFAAKGASAILYRDQTTYRYQPFSFEGWPSGRYATPNILGTRSGGAIAAAWAVMNYLGQEGYLRLARQIMDITSQFINGIRAIPGLEVWGLPQMSLFGYGSRTLDIFAVAEEMEAKGWYVNRQQDPPGIHLTITPVHQRVMAEYLADLAGAVRQVAAAGRKATDNTVNYA
ncbi:MAG: aminotransferase class V-fold PLP-dependent enzyme, partial [Candidatus Promineifilaceae bacterium]